LKFLHHKLLWLCFVCVFTGVVRADDFIITAEQRKHWSWQPLIRPELPSLPPPSPGRVKDTHWPRNPVDRYILARLEAAGLQPAMPASRTQLLRRVTLDLIGLPPTLDEIRDFNTDPSPFAWEKVIDRLLASPHYGERWGRHWLDLVRFAESNGYEFDELRPDAWRYRDYVIQSLNDDKPFDRFIKEQLAGDELFPADPQALVATGFNLLGPDMTDSSDQLQRRHNTLNDMTDTTALVFLGMTLGCARCHDHKFEPISQADYFRLQAFFAPAQFRHDLPVMRPDQRAGFELALARFKAVLQPLQDALTKLEEPHRHKLREEKLARLPEDVQQAHRTPSEQRSPAQQELVEKTVRQVGVALADVVKLMSSSEQARHRDLQEQIKKIDSRKPAVPTAMGLQESSGPLPRTFVLERGELGNPADEVQAGFPTVLLAGFQPEPARTVPPHPATSGRRSALAHWIASPANPLTSRVLVNRLWQHHFGRGIVRTANDFGVRGEAPTHPELLDWLAADFIAHGWSIKHMHKVMLCSATYQQSTVPAAGTLQQDPDNELFSRMNRLRLEGEVIRDSLLAVSGQLNRTLGGRSVFPPIPAEAIQGSKGWTVSADRQDHLRRSVYIFARRNLRFPFLEAFDLPDSNQSCPKRERSTTAPQALALLNAADVMVAARALSARIAAEAKSDPDRIALAYRLTLGREPTANELQVAGGFLNESPLSELCRALFNVNEFIYCD